jgi:hypothetical protein
MYSISLREDLLEITEEIITEEVDLQEEEDRAMIEDLIEIMIEGKTEVQEDNLGKIEIHLTEETIVNREENLRDKELKKHKLKNQLKKQTKEKKDKTIDHRGETIETLTIEETIDLPETKIETMTTEEAIEEIEIIETTETTGTTEITEEIGIIGTTDHTIDKTETLGHTIDKIGEITDKETTTRTTIETTVTMKIVLLVITRKSVKKIDKTELHSSGPTSNKSVLETSD